MQVGTWVATGFAAILTALRSWLQFRHNGRWYANDYLLGVALILHVALSVIISCAAPSLYHGLGAVAASATLNEAAVGLLQPSFLKYQFSALLLLWTALWTVKIAMLSFYWRLFNVVKTKARILWWIISGITIGSYLVSIVLQIVACDPPSQLFSPGMHLTHSWERARIAEGFQDSFVRPQNIAGFNRAFHFAAISDILTDILSKPFLRQLEGRD